MRASEIRPGGYYVDRHGITFRVDQIGQRQHGDRQKLYACWTVVLMRTPGARGFKIGTAGEWGLTPFAAQMAARWTRRCRVCRCHDRRACEGGCFWTEIDLCSSCVDAPKAAAS